EIYIQSMIVNSDLAEAVRIENAGGEIREISGGDKRVFVKGTNLPGLAVTRAIGDVSVACYGVIAEPQYERWEFPASDSVFIVVASDGVWEFMKAEEAHKILNKKLRLLLR
ncbi:protein phosphatase 2c, putative, partial [Perkinsus marinus ATCC 50983]